MRAATPHDPASLDGLLRAAHARMLAGRPGVDPGQYKSAALQALRAPRPHWGLTSWAACAYSARVGLGILGYGLSKASNRSGLGFAFGLGFSADEGLFGRGTLIVLGRDER
jgi:hypothetical protein